ncbi:MAG TPA: hypothetical protein VFF69_00890 [Phycisphaerales bacterium]|nr:hypothetical protein [Phycisphaerales bacterium]
MTSAQTMLAIRRRRLGAVLALAACAACLGACEALAPKRPELTPPPAPTAPYDASQGEVLWAVLPLRNESGTEIFDPLAVSDRLVAAAEEVEGIRTVPLNRTLQAMHALDITAVRDPADVHRIADAMGVDGVIVGSITAYDPYDPPTIGLSLALYARTHAMSARRQEHAIDPRALTSAPTDGPPDPRVADRDRPAAVASAHLDAKDHAVLAAIKAYAEGRHDPRSALGWKRYTASMDLYTQFATQHLVSALLAKEQRRLGALAEVSDTPPP